MSNLGLYKVMTTLAKRVGGPMNLFLLTAGCGYGIGRLTEAVIKRVIKRIMKSIKHFKEKPEDFPEYTLDKGFILDSGIILFENEKVRVIDEVEEGVLVARESDQYPFFILKEDLRKISSYN